MQFDSTALEGSISDVKVTTLELKAELGKNTQKLLALTQRLETLERRPARTITRNHSVAPPHMMTPTTSMARAPSMAPAPGLVSNPSMAAGLLAAAATSEVATTAAEADPAVAPASPATGSASAAGPSVNFATDVATDAALMQKSPASPLIADAASPSGILKSDSTGHNTVAYHRAAYDTSWQFCIVNCCLDICLFHCCPVHVPCPQSLA